MPSGADDNDVSDETTEEHNDVVVKMIDFPHVVPSSSPGPDTNYLSGLQLLIDDLSLFIETHGQRGKKKKDRDSLLLSIR